MTVTLSSTELERELDRCYDGCAADTAIMRRLQRTIARVRCSRVIRSGA